ncbi:MAG: beta-xylosidase, partial [Acidobacteriaceae bacterium]|nr:beta-xylosidase [Acidobacteriaceae bacterium]
MRHFFVPVFCLLPLLAVAQQPVTVRVDASQRIGPFKPSWAYFGYDEPNYTYAKDGKKLVGELAALSRAPVRIRTHNLLTTGDGTPGLKFGSTNAYTEDSSGKPVYDWTIVDKIIGTYLQAGAKPLVELGFMPKALSSKPEPYTPNFRTPADFKDYYLGWSYPPKDYEKWGELVYQLVKHSVEKYGKEEVQSWDWEVWNEPNISYWHGTPEEYDKLYDYSASALKRALPTARIGGPGSTSPRSPKAADFLRQFLQHCSDKKVPLDYISFHAKGSPDVNGGHVRMGISSQMKDVATGFEIVRSFSKLQDLPIILTESDPEGCAACSSQINPANAYRNGPLYPTYVAAALNGMLQLADRNRANLQGILTWAFEFEDKPYFAGYRDLATNGVDKPVLNVFRIAGLMSGDRVNVSSDGAGSLDTLVNEGVRQKPVVDALATRSDRSLSVMVWNYQDDDVSGPAANVDLKVAGVPAEAKRVLIHHYRIDNDHSNAYTVWKQMGSPEHPSAEEYAKLETAGQLQ